MNNECTPGKIFLTGDEARRLTEQRAQQNVPHGIGRFAEVNGMPRVSCGADVENTGEILRGIRALEKMIAEHYEVLHKLQAKLDPVLIQGEIKDTVESVGDKTMTPLGGELMRRLVEINGCTKVVCSILDRLQL